MDPTVKLIFSIFAAATVLLNLYGAFTANRKFFLWGLCLFSVLPIIGESTGFSTDGASVHIAVLTLYVVQLILTFPVARDTANDNNAVVSKLIFKMMLSALVINIGGVIYILCFNSGVPHRFGYCHIVLALSILYMMSRRMSGKAFWS